MKKKFSKDETAAIAREIIAKLEPGPQATVVALSGDLGAGKTTLAQAIAREFGIKEHVVSPTFVIMKEYELRREKYRRFIHIDAYRINSGQELLALGWKEITANPDNIVFVEWPEQAAAMMPGNVQKIKLMHAGELLREIEF